MIFYSEILNQYYALTCTRRTLELIEDAKGFDNYILKVTYLFRFKDELLSFSFFSVQQTHEVDLKSDIGMQLKREMLVKLAKKATDLYPEDKEKRETIFNRYKNFVIPLEEAEWVGLKPWEALTKQKKIEEENLKKSIKPLKEILTQNTLEQLKSGVVMTVPEPITE